MTKTALSTRGALRGIAVVAAFALAVGLAACSSTGGNTASPPQKLSVAFSQQTVDLSPYGSANAQQGQRVVGKQIFDTLVVQDESSGEFVPSLATKWTQPDDLTWVFTLREAKFHNGDAVTADDVVADIEYLAASASPLSGLWGTLDTATADSASVVRITTKEPVGTMLA